MSEADKFDFGKMSFQEMVFQAMGYASMCWSEIPTGVFQGTQAREVGEALVAELERRIAAGPEPKGNCRICGHLADVHMDSVPGQPVVWCAACPDRKCQGVPKVGDR